VEAIAAAFEVVAVEEGGVVMRRGQEASFVALVLEGAAAVEYESLEVASVSAGDILGLPHFFLRRIEGGGYSSDGGGGRSADVVVTQVCVGL
jgi:CRP-like cAMP-binding protein